MELYNSLFKETQQLLDGGTPRVWDYEPASVWKEIGSSELVLQKDAAYELGASGRGSANYVLFSSSAELVDRDRVLLYGPDLGEIRGECDFARIVLLRVGVLEGDDEKVYRTLKDIEFAKYRVNLEGYMIRMSPESYREQVRVSRQALRRGINFRQVGNFRQITQVVAALASQVSGADTADLMTWSPEGYLEQYTGGNP